MMAADLKVCATKAALTVLLIVHLSAVASAQTVEIEPLAGYRFGGDLFEFATDRLLDIDGAPVVGAVVNVPLGQGLLFEAQYTHQQAHIVIPGGSLAAPARWHAVADQWLAGGCQEFGTSRVRPFLTGLLGLTRFAVAGDNEVRFTVGAGGGVKLPVQRRLGVRLDGRVFTTFVDADAQRVVCVTGACLVNLHVTAVWQMEFTAGLFVVF
jgi:hypothetical protein